MFLTPEQVQELTGYRRPSMQRMWLERSGVPYFTSRSGKPIILRSDLEQRTMPRDGPPKNQRLRLAASSV